MQDLIINVKLFEKSGLSLEKFVYLQILVEEIEHDFDYSQFFSVPTNVVLSELERGMYIKVIDGQVFPRQGALDLFGVKQNDTTFEEFWERYHQITGKPKTDKNPAEKHFRRLTKKQKKQALDMIEPYFNSLNDSRYCKKARTYLADKNFQDEYLTEHSKGDDPFLQRS